MQRALRNMLCHAAFAVLADLALPPPAASQPLFTYDTALFRAGLQQDPGALELEVYVMVQRASLQFALLEEGAQGGYRARLELRRGLQTLADTSWERLDFLEPGERPEPHQKLPDMAALPVSPGMTRIRIVLEDLLSGRVREMGRRLDLRALSGTPELSEHRISVMPPEPAGEGPFIRRGYRVVPYADALFGSGLDTIHGLVEIYDVAAGAEVVVTHRILGEMQNLIESRSPVPADSLEERGDIRLARFALPVEHLPSGAYFLETLLLDAAGTALAGSQRTFWMENPGAAPLPVRHAGDEYDLLSADELSELWEKSRILASLAEEQSWESLDHAGRREFLRAFWERRDREPRTAVNEAKVAHLLRIEEALRRFGDSGQAGYETDRGRIFVRYGPPSAVETDYGLLSSRFSFQLDEWRSTWNRGSGTGGDLTGSGHRDFELWVYDRLDGGAEFIFIDVQGFGAYELVHSTKTGEYFDPNWPRKLFP